MTAATGYPASTVIDLVRCLKGSSSSPDDPVLDTLKTLLTSHLLSDAMALDPIPYTKLLTTLVSIPAKIFNEYQNKPIDEYFIQA